MSPTLSTALMRTQSDRRLANLAGAGHERAFEALSERYRRELWRHCRRLLDDGRAEDAVQQAFLQAWLALGSGVQVDDMRAWLHRIAHHAAIDILRRCGVREGPLDEQLASGADPVQDIERRDLVRQTLLGVAALPVRQRTALLATVVGGREQAELAREMGVSHGALRQLVHAARTTLRSAVTAITPTPVTSWLATTMASEGSAMRPAAELAGGAGGAGLASVLLKAGATAVVAAGVASAGPAVVGGASRATAAHGSRPARTAGPAPPQSAPGGAAVNARAGAGSDPVRPPLALRLSDRVRVPAAPLLLDPVTEQAADLRPHGRWGRLQTREPGSSRPNLPRPWGIPGRTSPERHEPGRPHPYPGPPTDPRTQPGSAPSRPPGDHRPSGGGEPRPGPGSPPEGSRSGPAYPTADHPQSGAIERGAPPPSGGPGSLAPAHTSTADPATGLPGAPGTYPRPQTASPAPTPAPVQGSYPATQTRAASDPGMSAPGPR